MFLSILQSESADVAKYLHKLEADLPADLIARAIILDTSASAGDDLPRVVVELPDATEAEASMIEAAVASIGAPEYDLMRDRVLPQRFATTAEAPEALHDNLPGMSAANPATVDETTVGMLRNLITPNPLRTSGSDFPEDVYEGAHQRCYAHIVKALGIAPNNDPNRTVSEAQIQAIRRPAKFRKAVWEEVVTHLCREVRFFAIADKWWGPTGLWHSVYADVTTFNLLFIDTAVTTYRLELKPNAMTAMLLDRAMGLTIAAIKGIPQGGPILAEIAGLIWSAAKAQAGDGKVKGEVARIKSMIAPYYEETLKALGNTHKTTCGSWTALSEFGERVETGEITWPHDTTDLIRPHTYGFQYEALRNLLSVASRANSALPFKVWGIARHPRKSSKPRPKAEFDTKTKIWRTKTRSRCVGPDEYDEIFIGLYRDPPTGSGVHTEQFKALSEKLFGTGTKAANPDLAIAPKFLVDPGLRKKLGWPINAA